MYHLLDTLTNMINPCLNIFHSAKTSEMGRLRKLAQKCTNVASENADLSLFEIVDKVRTIKALNVSPKASGSSPVSAPIYDAVPYLSNEQRLLNLLLLQYDNGPSSSDSALWCVK